MTTALLGAKARDLLWAGSVIDVDVHANVPSLEALFPYLDPIWVSASEERGWRGPNVSLAYPAGAPTTARDEWRHDDRPPASTLADIRSEILDPWRVDFGILNCYYGVDTIRHPDWAPALARAVNDWLIAEWLDKEPRLRASLVIPARDPIAAAAEVDRVGGHPGFVQVMLPVRSERLYGQRYFWPLYEAIERNNLVASLQWGGTSEDAPSPTGFASWYAESYAAETQVYLAQLNSIIIEGVFQKYPGLRMSVLEGGFTWVPGWTWSVNKKWKGLRRDFPWVDRLPSEIVRDHIRFSVAPSDLGPVEHARKVIKWLGSEDSLMFATDYPHRHDDELERLLEATPASMHARIMSESAREWYGLP